MDNIYKFEFPPFYLSIFLIGQGSSKHYVDLFITIKRTDPKFLILLWRPRTRDGSPDNKSKRLSRKEKVLFIVHKLRFIKVVGQTTVILNLSDFQRKTKCKRNRESEFDRHKDDFFLKSSCNP